MCAWLFLNERIYQGLVFTPLLEKLQPATLDSQVLGFPVFLTRIYPHVHQSDRENNRTVSLKVVKLQ